MLRFFLKPIDEYNFLTYDYMLIFLYTNKVLKSLVKNWKKSHKKCGLENLILHHDNSPIHNSKIVNNFIKTKKIKLLKHPPYSPDLSPCYFWLFPIVKQRLRGKVNESKFDVINGFRNEVNKLRKNDFHKCYESWIKRCKKLIFKKGNYY